MVERKGKIRVAVMMGGFSSERAVSLSTGKQILESLDRDKYGAIGVDAAMLPGSTRQCLEGASEEVGAIAAAGSALAQSTKLVSVQDISSNGSGLRPDVVFIALHGKFGEDGTIQGMLDLLGIPYTGSGVLASALAMDKSMCKKVLAADGVPVPPSVDFACKDGEWDREAVASAVAKIGYPVIVKPSRQGSSIGLTKVNAPEELNNAIKEAAGYDGLIIVEKYLEGTELTVGVLGNDDLTALPVIEIVPKSGTYDYKSKYDPGATEEIVPARISEADTARAQELGLAAHRSLGCRGASRTDIIMTADGMYVLEVNTIPGMTPTSLLPTAAAAAGISFGRLLDMMIGFALEEGGEK
ncbi:MAG: D-alanine--D-alanine ligase [Armatimonadetes bacterium]|nr:D-alanine--D-alanine ligase [Armatimonadota bacterium]